jgi:hypothetical protein
MILECPRCRIIINWDRDAKPEGPGDCKCGAYAPYNVLKKMPDRSKGFVRIISSKGTQKLKGPNYTVDEKAWKNDQ